MQPRRPLACTAAFLPTLAFLCLASCNPMHQIDAGAPDTQAPGESALATRLLQEAADAADVWSKLAVARSRRADIKLQLEREALQHPSHAMWPDGALSVSRSGLMSDLDHPLLQPLGALARSSLQEASSLVSQCQTNGNWQALLVTAAAKTQAAERDWDQELSRRFSDDWRELAQLTWNQSGSPAVWRLVAQVAQSKLDFAPLQEAAIKAKSAFADAEAAEHAAQEWASDAATRAAQAASTNTR